ncbi:alanine racemase [Microvirga sp. W0021]|uniref:Alanine racemase n=1 Tax=Hohaiivirga grylli TaxID=3133970 RepID=A0ABV0BJ52_9HYPH
MSTGMNRETPHSDSTIPAAEAGGILTINLNALVANWLFLKSQAATAECAAVVKANAYGIGIEHAVPALLKAGCKTFFVALLSEAKRVRNITPDATIYVLNGLFADTETTYAAYNIRPVLGSIEELERWSLFCKHTGKKLPAALHIDTGMSRLGITPDDISTVAQSPLLESFELSLLMSHFVSSEEPDNQLNQRQIDCFENCRQLFPGIPASLSNSSGILLANAPTYDLLRPGYALYGGNPTPGKPNPMQEVVTLKGRIVQIRTVPAGTSIGYNSRWITDGEMRLATISIGYADGYPRSTSGTKDKHLANKPAGIAVVSGERCPFIGTVSMDLIIINITKIDPASVKVGDLVTLIGDGISVDDVGLSAGTNGYEVLTHLGKRYFRQYIGGDIDG